MSYIEWIFLGLGLSMDAAAVSLCQGLAAGRVKWRHCLTAGAYFGGFQLLMPLLGYILGRSFANLLMRYAHWIAFFLLVIIGANTLWEAWRGKEKTPLLSYCPRVMLPLAIATSIDAFAVGVSFSFFLTRWQLAAAVGIIGGITFLVAALAQWLGSLFGDDKSRLAQGLGGVVLLLIGLKILLEGLGYWPFG